MAQAAASDKGDVLHGDLSRARRLFGGRCDPMKFSTDMCAAVRSRTPQPKPQTPTLTTQPACRSWLARFDGMKVGLLG